MPERPALPCAESESVDAVSKPPCSVCNGRGFIPAGSEPFPSGTPVDRSCPVCCRRGYTCRVVISPAGDAPFDCEPFRADVRASCEEIARTRAFRMLKRTYGDGTPQGNPMWWRVTDVWWW